jgi:hypothetical protein
LKELEIDVIVPGHDPLCGRSEIEQNIRYLAGLLEGDDFPKGVRQEG